MKPKFYTKRFVVPTEAIDERNHVNNVVYLQWCLDAAEAHWKQEASAEFRTQYLWFVLQHIIDYKAPSFKGEELAIKTWVISAEGVRSTRQFEILRVHDQKLLVTAKTTWCLLDAKTERPTKITDEIRHLFLD